jgi:hypothetical protein
MKTNRLREIINECVRKALYEGVFDKTATPHHSKIDTIKDIGRNPLTVDNGGHPTNDKVRQPSTFDKISETENLFVSDNKFLIYKVKNFGNPDIKDTMQFFGNTPEFRRAYDTVRGAADRGGKPIYFRTISPESERAKIESHKFMIKTFWEFSFDRQEWYILKPNPVQSLKISKFTK